MCSACWQRRPERPEIRAESLIASLTQPPTWIRDFAAETASGFSPSRACTVITDLGRLLTAGQAIHPQALLEQARRPGRSMGTLARALESFFTARGLALPTDQAERLAAGRRRRRVDAVPEPLRPLVSAFADYLTHSQDRARRAGTRPRADLTIDLNLSIVRDLGVTLTRRGKHDWALADVHDIEAFLADQPKSRARRLVVLRQFFRFARSRRAILVDPARTLSGTKPSGFSGTTLSLDQQRRLFRRWTTDPEVHPHEALLGMLALLHGASSREVRMLRADNIDRGRRTVRLGNRPHPVPLDPASWLTLERSLAHRARQRTDNPHVMVTRQTKSTTASASTTYLSHLLDPCGVSPRTIRCTRLADLVNTMDPKLVAVAFGMDPEAVMIYLADQVDDCRLP